jgi:hypothetical protein
MPEPDKPAPIRRTPQAAPAPDAATRARPLCTGSKDDKVLCERCGAEMFRMHAVWRCPECRYKTDCCGW